MKVLVTGGGGFVGRHVCRVLVLRGHDVVALSRGGGAPQAEVTGVACDLADADAVAAVLGRERPEALVHLAWYTRPGAYWTAPENLDALAHGVRLVRQFREHGGRRFVGGGTCAEYDWSHARLDEATTPCRPRTLYGAAKLALGTVAERYAASCEMSFAWLRYHFLYGPDEHAERLVPSALAAFLAGRDFPASHGRQVRDFIHIADAARATVAVLESDIQGAVNIASGTPSTVRALLETLSDLVGGRGQPRFGERPVAADEPPILTASTMRLFDELGWRPELDLVTGLERCVADFPR